MRVVQAKKPNETGIAVLTVLVGCRYDQAKDRVVEEFGGDNDLTPAQMATMLNTFAIDPLNTVGDIDWSFDKKTHSRWVARHPRGAVQTLGDVISHICWVNARQTHPTAVLLRRLDSEYIWVALDPSYSEITIAGPGIYISKASSKNIWAWGPARYVVVATVRATF